jgi:hypothetical protein
MTISEIKRKTELTAPYYFSRKTMRFFGQTMRDFKVYKQEDGRYLITAPMRNQQGVVIGKSERYFNPINNKLEIC